MTKKLFSHFFQSEPWADFQKALGKQIINRSGDGWQYIAVKEEGYGRIGQFFHRLYVPYGPSYTDNKALKNALADLEKTARENKVDYIRVEPVCLNPDKALAKIQPGYSRLKRPFQPQLTLILDLNRPFEEVLKGIAYNNRQRWNKAVQNGLTFSISNKVEDIGQFLKMMAATSQRTRAAFHPNSYFKVLLSILGPKNAAYVAYAYYDKEPLTGILVCDDMVAKTRYYLYAGSYDKARKYNANAPLLTYLIKDAHQKGLLNFDMFGISPLNEPNHRWAGFSQFKRSFGGYEKAYSGTWEKPVRPLRYKVLSAARKLA